MNEPVVRQRVATLKNLKYIQIFINTFWLLHDRLIVMMFLLLFYNVENSKNKEKPLNE